MKKSQEIVDYVGNPVLLATIVQMLQAPLLNTG
jgi:hypothetical protein